MVIVALLLLVGGGFCGWFIGQNGWDFREWGKEKDSYSMESAVSEEDEDKDKDNDDGFARIPHRAHSAGRGTDLANAVRPVELAENRQ